MVVRVRAWCVRATVAPCRLASDICISVMQLRPLHRSSDKLTSSEGAERTSPAKTRDDEF